MSLCYPTSLSLTLHVRHTKNFQIGFNSCAVPSSLPFGPTRIFHPAPTPECLLLLHYPSSLLPVSTNTRQTHTKQHCHLLIPVAFSRRQRTPDKHNTEQGLRITLRQPASTSRQCNALQLHPVLHLGHPLASTNTRQTIPRHQQTPDKNPQNKHERQP